MTTINLVHVLPSLRTGGAEVFTVNLLRTLNRQRYKCSLITLHSPEKDNHLLRKLQEANIAYHSLKKGRGFSVKTVLMLGNLLKKIKPHIIHTHLHTMKYIFFAKFRSPLPPWIHTVHSIEYRETPFLEKKLADILYKSRRVKAIAVSYAVGATLKKHHHVVDMKVIHNGVKCDSGKQANKSYYRKQLSLPLKGTVIVSLSRLVPQKNHSLLIDAFVKFQKEYQDCFLILIGDGPLRRDLEQKITQLNIKERIKIIGRVRDPEPYLKAADIFTLSSDREGLPLSLLEAMKTGLPVVATKAGGVPEVVDHSTNGYLVDIGDTEGFTRALTKLVSSNRRITLGKMAQKKILTKFNIETAARDYESIYEQALLSN